MRAIFASLICLLIAGCSTVDVRPPEVGVPLSQPLAAKYYDVNIPSYDGTLLRATIYQPDLAAGETAPLIITAHGFGGFRTPRPLSIYGQFVITGEAAIAAWRRKYWVISYDQRGFGDSEGDIQLQHPDYEVKDVSAIIDWAARYLSRLQRDNENDLIIGMVGESYGGGTQLLASIMDERIDAIVPVTTWYNLADSIAPNGHVKTAWGGLLLTAGTLSSFFDFPKMLEEPYLNMFNGKLDPVAAQEMEIRSASHYCQQGKAPHADALYIQGFRDTVFSLNQGLKNWECSRKAGKDARLVAIQDGHMLPWPMQKFSGMPLYYTQNHIQCGSYQQETTEMIMQWFDTKLKSQPEMSPIPKLCITLPDHPGLVLESIPVGGVERAVSNAEVSLVQAGLLEVVLEPVDRLAGVVWSSDEAKTLHGAQAGGSFRPAFIPLQEIRQRQLIVGVPTLEIDMQTTDDEQGGVAFVGIGVRRQGTPYIELLDEQLTPIPGAGHYKLALNAVASVLEPGDVVGLQVQGFSGQYFFNPEGLFDAATLTGKVALPLLADHPGVMVADHHGGH